LTIGCSQLSPSESKREPATAVIRNIAFCML
jgi:hypothetical protein